MLSVEENGRFFSSHSILKSRFFQHREKRISTKCGNHEKEWQAGTCQVFFQGWKRERWKMNSAHWWCEVLRDNFLKSRVVSLLGVIARNSISGSRARTRRVRRADRDDSLYVTSAESGRFPVRTRCVQRPEHHRTRSASRTHIHRAVCVIYLSCVTPTLVGTLSLYERKKKYIYKYIG